MWVRSQDKEKMIDLNVLRIWRYNEDMYHIRTQDMVLGIYSTKEKALKVLDMIEKRMIGIEMEEHKKIYMRTTYELHNPTITYACKFIFQMPQDNEV